jgi:hypothetical protein
VRNGKERLTVVVPSRAYLKEARAYARKLRRYDPGVRVDPSTSPKVRHDHLVTDVSVAFGGFGQTQVIPVPPNAVLQFSQG